MSDFRASEGVFGVIEFIAWVAVIAGIVIAMVGANAAGFSIFARSSAAGMIGAAPGLIITFVGILLVALTQVFRAVVSVAQTNSNLLAVSKEQLRLAKAQYDGNTAPKAFFDNKSSGEQTGAVRTTTATAAEAERKQGIQTPTYGQQPALEKIGYRGKTIRKTEDAYFIGELKFATLEPAKAFIDKHFQEDEAAKSSVLQAVRDTGTRTQGGGYKSYQSIIASGKVEANSAPNVRVEHGTTSEGRDLSLVAPSRKPEGLG